MNKFIIKTFGCKTNQIESEYIKELLKKNGYSETSFEKEASFCVVNSCTVTENADKKVLSYINNLKNKNKDIKVIAVGCYCQTHKDEAGNGVSGGRDKLRAGWQRDFEGRAARRQCARVCGLYGQPGRAAAH